MSNCIFPGRFQPFHTGQLLVVKGMMKTCGRAVIVICSNPGDSKGKDDLFTQDQVREMITAALLAEDIVDAEIVAISDCESDEEWLHKVLEAADNPEDPTVWSGNEDVLAIVEKGGVNTKKIVHVLGHDSDEIRKMIKSGNRDWMKKVPGGANNVVMKSLGN